MPTTETASPRYHGLDLWSDDDILQALLEGQLNAIATVRMALPALQQAAQALYTRLQDERSRVVYIGAGASGHLALQDGMEMTPTFGWPAQRLVLLMAGGDAARLQAGGTYEDDAAAAQEELTAHDVNSQDAVIAVAASGTTAYTVAAVRLARERGALTIGIANNPATELLQYAEYPVLLDTGPEVIAGSTRLNAGTAQKAALGLLSTLVMTRLGHVLDGYMINMTVDNAKLRERAVKILIALSHCQRDEALTALARCQNRVKPAVLVLHGMDPSQAERLLQEHQGRLRQALKHFNRP